MYRPTVRNGQVASFYSDRGFEAIADDDAAATWELDLAARRPVAPEWITIRRIGLE